MKRGSELDKVINSEVYAQAGKLLAKCRNERRLSLIQLSCLTGYSAGTLDLMEKGNTQKWASQSLNRILWLFRQFDMKIVISLAPIPRDTYYWE